MKIICTKKEFAKLIASCAKSDSCEDCALFDICDTTGDTDTLINLCEIREQEE